MKKFFLFLLIGLLSYAISLIAQAPLSTILTYTPKPSGIRIGAANGKLWMGELYQVQYQNIPPIQKVMWDFKPVKLLQGHLALDIEAELLEGKVQGECSINWRTHVQCLNLSATFPAEVIKRLPLPMVQNLATPSGEALAYFERITWSRSGLPSITGDIHWQQPALQAPFSLALGERYSANLRTSNETQQIAVELSSLNTQLEINGSQATLAPNGDYQLNMVARSAANASLNIKNTLMMLGQAQADGTYQFALNGKLNLPPILSTP